jgi:hypothetical protein
MNYKPQPPDAKHVWQFDHARHDWFYLSIRSDRVYYNATPRVSGGQQLQPANAQSATVATRLAELSSKADVLLDKHQRVLSELGLSVAFNRCTLATKYWLPLPGDNEFALEPNVGTSSGGRSLAQALENGVRCLDRFDRVATQGFANPGDERVGDDVTARLTTSFHE